MKTTHYNTPNSPQSSNIIDLAELRRRRLAQQDCLARLLEEEPWEEVAPEEPSGFCPVVLTVTPEERRRARQERRAWRLDAFASLAVILMTVVFALRILL